MLHAASLPDHAVHPWALGPSPLNSRRQRRCRHAAWPSFRQPASVSAAPVTSRTADQLSEWLEGKSLSLSRQSVTPAPAFSQGPDLGLVTSRAASPGEALASVPESLWITAAVAAKSELGAALAQLQEPWLQLALFLVAERAKGAGSQWAGYLASLPDRPQSPLFWKAEQLALLDGTQLQQSLDGYRAFFSGKFQEVEAAVMEADRSLFPANVFTEDAFLWAVSVVRCRVHAPLDGDQLALVPLADLVQHERRVPGEWRIDSGGLFGGAQTLRFGAGRQYAAGELVTMDFGPDKLDSQLLLDYGVLDTAQPQGGFMLALSIPEDDRYFDDKADILDVNGFSETWQFALRPGQAPEEGLLAFLRLVNLSGADAFMLEALFRADAWGFMLQPVSPDNERAVCQSMIDGCREALRAYSSTIDEDLRLLGDEAEVAADSAEHKAILVRLGEKEALDSTLRFFEDRASRLSDLEYYQERRLKGLGLMDDNGGSTYDDFFKDGVA